MKYCPNCGVAVEEGQRFCGECGVKLEFDPLPAEPVYTDDERLKNDPKLRGAQPAPTGKRKKDKVPELTLEPDLWGMGAAAAAAAPAEAAKPAEPARPAQAAEAVAPVEQREAPSIAHVMEDFDYERPDAEYHGPAQGAQAAEAAAPVEQREAPSIAHVMEDFDYERPDAEYHGPAQSAQGDYHAPEREAYDLPHDYTMSGDAQAPAKKLPDETLMLIWSIVLTCLCSVCGIVGLVKTIKARKEPSFALRSKLLNSAKIWLIVGTALRVLPFLAELL